MKKSANYYCDKIDTIIYRLYKYMDETGVCVRHQVHELTILQKSFYDELSKQ
jgi:transcriptional regulator